MCRSRAFKNGMTLAYWIKIEVSRAPKALTFVMNFHKSKTTVQGDLGTSIFTQYESVIPFWKALDMHI